MGTAALVLWQELLDLEVAIAGHIYSSRSDACAAAAVSSASKFSNSLKLFTLSMFAMGFNWLSGSR